MRCFQFWSYWMPSRIVCTQHHWETAFEAAKWMLSYLSISEWMNFNAIVNSSANNYGSSGRTYSMYGTRAHNEMPEASQCSWVSLPMASDYPSIQANGKLSIKMIYSLSFSWSLHKSFAAYATNGRRGRQQERDGWKIRSFAQQNYRSRANCAPECKQSAMNAILPEFTQNSIISEHTHSRTP